MDWRTQLRRHRRVLTFVLGGVAAVAAAGLAVQVARGRRQAGLAARVAELTDKAERLSRALGRVVEDPDRPAPVAPPRRKGEAIRADAVGGAARGPAASRRVRARPALRPALASGLPPAPYDG